MSFRKVSRNGGSMSVTLPKDELELLGIVDSSGELDGEHWAKVESVGGGRFEIELVNVAE